MSVIPNGITGRLHYYNMRFYFRGGLTLSEALDMVYADENIANQVDEIFIEPPETNVVTDEDSADEDEGGMIHNLTGRQLRAPVEVKLIDNTRLCDNSVEPSTVPEEPPASTAEVIHEEHLVTDRAAQANYSQYEHLSYVDIFERFFDNKIIEYLVEETQRYAIFLNQPDPKISANEIKCFLAILILSGYNTLPSKRMYWDLKDDAKNILVSSSMRRNRFLQIQSYLGHLGYGAVGTIRENRIPKSCTLLNKKAFSKKRRGEYQHVIEKNSGILLMRWLDNSVVTMASTDAGVSPVGSVKRFSLAEKCNILVARPYCVAKYNQNMGGTDLMDEVIELV
ncbi:hypothetical protein NQ314_011755 [Rhamnusium bicolor]|uniref:PiggyBac transposable element-derived protein domain-containing protein n=1 Tax=Rhamnusium bicolor TaxID=1586634 RepID=A0AAV8XHZ7_9CUCU|nr:hypothetical protein NQ314_011755 [Rhamnusium bicolor]